MESAKRLELIKECPEIILKMKNMTDKEFETAIECDDDNIIINQLTDERLIRLAVRTKPVLIKVVNQTLELCKIAIEKDPYFISKCKYQDYDMAMRAAKHQYTALAKYIRQEFMDEKLLIALIENDAVNIKYIPDELQSDKIITMALNSWAKSILWVAKDKRNRFLPMAIERNISTMPDEDNIPDNIKQLFKKLSIERNYFDKYWVERLDYTQDEIYRMLKNAGQWIENAVIFHELSEEYKLKALKEGIFTAYFNNAGYEIAYFDKIKDIKNKELLVEIIPYFFKNIEKRRVYNTRKYSYEKSQYHEEKVVDTQPIMCKLQEMIASLNEAELLQVVSKNGDILKRIPIEKRTIELERAAIENSPTAAKYITFIKEILG